MDILVGQLSSYFVAIISHDFYRMWLTLGSNLVI